MSIEQSLITILNNQPCVPHLVYELSNESALAVAAGENKTSLTMILDGDCQVWAHPHLLPAEKFEYTLNRSVSLGPSKNFNQRIFNYTQMFASDNDYILFAQCSNIYIWRAAFQFKHFLQMMIHSTLWIRWKEHQLTENKLRLKFLW